MDNRTTIQPPDMEHNEKHAGQGDTPEDVAMFFKKTRNSVKRSKNT